MIGLIARLSSLVRADAHGIVDVLEDRRLILRQSLREAELELDRKRARIGALEAEVRSLTTAEERLVVAMGTLDEDVDLALAGDKEDLARFSLKKLIPMRGERARLVERLKTAEEEKGLLVGRLAEQDSEFEDLKLRVKLGLARSSGPEAGPTAVPLVADEDVELELLRRRGARPAPARKGRGAK